MKYNGMTVYDENGIEIDLSVEALLAGHFEYSSKEVKTYERQPDDTPPMSIAEETIIVWRPYTASELEEKLENERLAENRAWLIDLGRDEIELTSDALAELSGAVSDNADTVETDSDAIAELSAIVSELATTLEAINNG